MSDQAPAIAVDGLWQVFGANAEQALAEEKAKGATSAEVASALRARGLVPAVQDATFEVGQGELFVIMGLSGSGKSTLIRGISRLVEPTAGGVKIAGEDILKASKKRMTQLRRETLGMVFQHFGLFPHMKVIDNVAFPLKVCGMGREARHAKVQSIIEMVGLAGKEQNYPRELSGGQRQRVGIARSLAGDCDVWFLDEPFSALDPLIRRQLQDEFLDIQEKLKTSIVFITHDIAEALKLADRIAIMRDGQIVQIGTPTEIVLNPVDDYVREFARDIPKGRHMKLAAVMEPAGSDAKPTKGLELRANMTLDEALANCTLSLDPMEVKDGDGKVVGLLRPDALSRALGDSA